MSGGNPDAAHGTGTAGAEAPRRRRPDRPPTVPLSEFGKEPPPPPRVQLTHRQIATYSAVTLAVLLIVGIIAVQVGNASSSYWSRAGCIDARRTC
ncbi:MAG: hypothetical protein AVDCRST_MAG77-2094 [uncultured Chloroflexi bacterium]|uniref:Uncharacterized protein n=1 Tax=uncultured Chloroflexota bacterium TaxID=166587 RepID=A0A6J4IDL5_9CHLR|nr:MAG: hypothetical protein AVDCRST_MAG77-2094 [uncultured Chloroflexota bacterium]